MKTVYVVTSGEYSDYAIDRIFENLDDAEKFCAIQNDSGTSDPCNIEFWELTESGTFQKTECHKAIRCRFSRFKDDGYIKVVSWHIGYSKEPFPFEFTCTYNPVHRLSPEYWEATIPVMHTYDPYKTEDELTVEKIVKDSYYIYRAMEEGIC